MTGITRSIAVFSAETPAATHPSVPGSRPRVDRSGAPASTAAEAAGQAGVRHHDAAASAVFAAAAKSRPLDDADPGKEWLNLQRLQHEQQRAAPAESAPARVPAALRTLFP